MNSTEIKNIVTKKYIICENIKICKGKMADFLLITS